VLTRFILYGMFGWCSELAWTSIRFQVTAFRERRPIDWKLPGRTYLWMLPVYGSGGLLFELVHAKLSGAHWGVRGTVYMLGCFTIEYIAGWVIKRVTGSVPWDYERVSSHVHGLIRLDFAPLWFGFGLLLEHVERVVRIVAPVV